MEEQQAGETLKESEREELKRLRKEVKNLMMEKKIPKKAASSLRRK